MKPLKGKQACGLSNPGKQCHPGPGPQAPRRLLVRRVALGACACTDGPFEWLQALMEGPNPHDNHGLGGRRRPARSVARPCGAPLAAGPDAGWAARPSL